MTQWAYQDAIQSAYEKITTAGVLLGEAAKFVSESKQHTQQMLMSHRMADEARELLGKILAEVTG